MADSDSGKNNLLSQVIEGLRQEPAYLLAFGLYVLFIFFGAGVYGMTSGQLFPQHLGFGSFLIVLLVGLAAIRRVEAPHANTTVRATPNVIYDNWNSEKIYKALENAPPDATIRILQIWFPEENFISCLEHLFTVHRKRFSP